MKIRNFLLVVILLILAQNFAFADRQLNRTEILQIFKTLTDQPRRTWISGGTIRAAHHEYKSSEGYIIDSTVTVKYDGDKFYWEINIDSYIKQNHAGQSSQENIDMKWNKKRVFAWDGERHTMYFRPGNHATVRESPSDFPVGINGPLTAGIVPWGHGVFTLENLSAAESSAEVDGQEHVHLTVNMESGLKMVFVLDPAKDYALLSYSLYFEAGSSIITTYGDYESVLGKWIPTTITIDRYNNSKPSSELVSCDHWDLTSISPVIPQAASFRVPYETDALVEFYPLINKKALWYRHYSEVDTDSLLEKKLVIASAKDKQNQNCATVAMKYVSERLGKNVTDQELAGLVSEPNKSTDLYSLRQFARELDLHCLAVKTDISTLKNLKDCQVILHLPSANHYVVFEYIDNEYVWVIDLDSNKFFYRTKLKDFGRVWSAGTALLISDKPLDVDPNNTPISDSELQKITGSTRDSLSDFSCTDHIQEYNYLLCPFPIGGLCGGRYWLWPNRWGCYPASEGNICTSQDDMPGNYSSPCINHTSIPNACDTSDWITKNIRACN